MHFAYRRSSCASLNLKDDTRISHVSSDVHFSMLVLAILLIRFSIMGVTISHNFGPKFIDRHLTDDYNWDNGTFGNVYSMEIHATCN